jgi:hypothetical protein
VRSTSPAATAANLSADGRLRDRNLSPLPSHGIVTASANARERLSGLLPPDPDVPSPSALARAERELMARERALVDERAQVSPSFARISRAPRVRDAMRRIEAAEERRLEALLREVGHAPRPRRTVLA